MNDSLPLAFLYNSRSHEARTGNPISKHATPSLRFACRFIQSQNSSENGGCHCFSSGTAYYFVWRSKPFARTASSTEELGLRLINLVFLSRRR